MSKFTYRKVTLIGLLLFIISTIMAAIMPRRADNDQKGKLVASTCGFGNQKSCHPTAHPECCTVTAGTATTNGAGGYTSANKDSSNGLHSSECNNLVVDHTI